MPRPSTPLPLLRALVVGGVVGIAGGVVVSGGCKPDSAEAFNEELAVAICEVRRNCPDLQVSAMTGSVVFPDDDTCEMAVLTQFEGCGTSCDYKPSSASACLRRLERMAGDCQDRSVGPCRRAYKNCQGPGEGSRCNLHACASRVGAPSSEGLPWLAFAALGLLGVARRRRRRAA